MEKETLIEIKVKRVNNEIEFTVDCSKGVTSEELAHYLESIIEGICKWKPDVCEANMQTISGKIQQTKRTK
jgi:hypothetical protein